MGKSGKTSIYIYLKKITHNTHKIASYSFCKSLLTSNNKPTEASNNSLLFSLFVILSSYFQFTCLWLCVCNPFISITLIYVCNMVVDGGRVVALTLTARRFVSSATGTRCMPLVLFTYYFSSNVILTIYLLMYLVLTENVTVMFLFENNISIFFRNRCV